MKESYDVYLAGPFFTPEQKDVMDATKFILTANKLSVCDPRDLSPVLTDLPQDEKAKHVRSIFENNIEGMRRSWAIVACIDDRDTGTSFELGYFFAMRKRELDRCVVTFSASGFGCNVMLAEAADAHFANLVELDRAMPRLAYAILDKNRDYALSVLRNKTKAGSTE